MTLRIKNWETHFENNRTKELKKLSWVPFPNKHDGDGYTELLDHPQGAAHYGVWCVIVQVASKCDKRGTLLRDTGKPHDSRSLSRITRIPVKIMEEAIRRLISIKWLEVYDNPAPSCGDPAPSCGLPEGKGMEGNGMEWNGTEVKGREGTGSVPPANTGDVGPSVKKSYGEERKVKLTDEEYAKLAAKHPTEELKAGIEILDAYIAYTGKRYASHYAVLKEYSWVWQRLAEKGASKPAANTFRPASKSKAQQWNDALEHTVKRLRLASVHGFDSEEFKKAMSVSGGDYWKIGKNSRGETVVEEALGIVKGEATSGGAA